MSFNLTLHDSITTRSFDFLYQIEKHNISWLKGGFLRNEFYEHVESYPEYKKYLDGEDFTERITDEKKENKRIRNVLKNLIKSENSLDFVISLCSSELSKIEHQNRLSLTTVSKKLL